MATIATIASPFRCRWIQRGSEMRVSNWSFAVCERVHDHPRVVSEPECAQCPLWAGPDDHRAASDG